MRHPRTVGRVESELTQPFEPTVWPENSTLWARWLDPVARELNPVGQMAQFYAHRTQSYGSDSSILWPENSILWPGNSTLWARWLNPMAPYYSGHSIINIYSYHRHINDHPGHPTTVIMV